MAYSIPNVAKTIGAGLATAGVVAGALLANATFVGVVPPFVVAILTTLVAAGIVAGVVFGIPNTLTPEQLQKQAANAGLAVGTAVTTAVAEKVGAEVKSNVQAVLPNILDGPAGAVVDGITDVARNTVEDLLNRYKLVVPH